MDVKGLKGSSIWEKEGFLKHYNTDVACLDNSCFLSRWRGQHFPSLFQAKAWEVFLLITQNIPIEAPLL